MDTSFIGFNWETITGAMAIYAFVQSVYLSVRSRLIRAAVQFSPQARCEVGFSAMGPTVGLIGSFLCTGRPCVVEQMRLRLSRAGADEAFEFDWIAFRNAVLSLEGNKSTAETTAAFALTPGVPKPLNVLLCQPALQERFGDYLTDVRQQFLEGLTAAQAEHPEMPQAELLQGFAQHYWQSEEGARVRAFFDENFFWRPGAYQMRILVMRSDLKKEALRETLGFSLSEREVETLKDNYWRILNELFGIGITQHLFVYPRLERSEGL